MNRKINRNPISTWLLMTLLMGFCSFARAQTGDILPPLPDSLRSAPFETLQLQHPETFSSDAATRSILSSDAVKISPVKGAPWIDPRALGIEPPRQSVNWYNQRGLRVSPFGLSYLNDLEGGNVAGIGTSFRVNDRLSLGGQTYISSAFMGAAQPNRVMNGSVRLSANYWVSDWLMVYGHGQYSVGGGINPMYAPMIGPANVYGGGVQVKITDKIGFGVGVSREYWQGDWNTRYQYYPMFY